MKRYFRQAWSGVRRAEAVFAIAALTLSAVLAILPTGCEKTADRSVRARALILETMDDGVRNYGVILQGEQVARIRVLSGAYLTEAGRV
jgi:hypothetical protein